MDNLIMKEVCFKSKKIRAIEENGKIYVAVKDICNNLGMNGDHYRNQKKKIQKDELLKGGSKLTPLESNGGIQETMLLELDYLPIWLAKINPARFSDELKKELMDYQLKAKDVLAEAFLGKRRMYPELFYERQNKRLPRGLPISHSKFHNNGKVVMLLQDLADVLGISRFSVSQKITNKTVISGTDLLNFKKENPEANKSSACLTLIDKNDAVEILSKVNNISDIEREVIIEYFEPYMTLVKTSEHWERLKSMQKGVTESGLHLFQEMKKLDESLKVLHEIKKDIIGRMQFMNYDIHELEK